MLIEASTPRVAGWANRNDHRVSAPQGRVEDVPHGIDRDDEVPAPPLHREREPGPTGRQPGLEREAVGPDDQTGEPEDRHQPYAAQGRDMDAAGDGHVAVAEIDGRGLAKVAERHLRPSQPGGGDTVQGAAEGAAMAAPRGVVVEVDRPRVARELLGEQGEEGNDIGCLTTCEAWVRSRPRTTSIGTERPA